jgi:hypothetical protein
MGVTGEWTSDDHEIAMLFIRDGGAAWAMRAALVCPLEYPGGELDRAAAPCLLARDGQGQPTGEPAPGCILRADWVNPLAEYLELPGSRQVWGPPESRWRIEWRWERADECFVWKPVDAVFHAGYRAWASSPKMTVR